MLTRFQKVVPLYVALIVVAVAALIPGTSAAIPSDEMQSPFEQGTRWYVCQGYDNQNGTHKGTSTISLDLTGSPNCGSSATGAPILSPFTGNVSWYTDSSGSLCITERGGRRSVMLTHIYSSLTRGTVIKDGDLVGHIAAPGQKQNNGSAHLHIQAWNGSSCMGPAQNVTFDRASNMKICGAPNMTGDGPRRPGLGTWGGITFIAKKCAPDPAPELSGQQAVYRFWSPTYNHHFYTASYEEMKATYDQYSEDIWSYEGVAYYTPTASNQGATPVYRFWSEEYYGHFYTSSEAERQKIITTYPERVWRYEGVVFQAYNQQDTSNSRIPVYRFWSDTHNGHFYTKSAEERDQIIQKWPSIWTYEGPVYYVAN